MAVKLSIANAVSRQSAAMKSVAVEEKFTALPNIDHLRIRSQDEVHVTSVLCASISVHPPVGQGEKFTGVNTLRSNTIVFVQKIRKQMRAGCIALPRAFSMQLTSIAAVKKPHSIRARRHHSAAGASRNGHAVLSLCSRGQSNETAHCMEKKTFSIALAAGERRSKSSSVNQTEVVPETGQ